MRIASDNQADILKTLRAEHKLFNAKIKLNYAPISNPVN